MENLNSQNIGFYDWIRKIKNRENAPTSHASHASQNELTPCNHLDKNVTRTSQERNMNELRESESTIHRNQININSLDQDFAQANLVLRFHSELLGEDFFLISNQDLKAQMEAEYPEIVVYLPAEIEYLSGLKPEEVKKLHFARKLFGGEFVKRNHVSKSIFAKTGSEQNKNEGIYNPRSKIDIS